MGAVHCSSLSSRIEESYLTRHRKRMTIASGRRQRREQLDDTSGHVLFFVTFQRRQPDLRLAGVGSVNGFAVVTEGFLRKPLRVAAHFCPLCPSVAIGVQRNSLDSKPKTALVKLRRAVAAANGLQVTSLRPLIPEHQLVAAIAWVVLGLGFCNQFCQRYLLKCVYAQNL